MISKPRHHKKPDSGWVLVGLLAKPTAAGYTDEGRYLYYDNIQITKQFNIMDLLHKYRKSRKFL